MARKAGSALLARLLPQRWRMRRDWDRRAREDAQHFIACGHSETDAAFWESGRRDLVEQVLHDVELDSSARALEIGCGVGRLLRPLSERVARAYGVDISHEMIARGQALLADRPNIELYTTTGRLSRNGDASLDFVFSFIVFQHISTKAAVSEYIREAARVLAGGGVFRFQVDGRARDPRRVPDTWLGVWYERGELEAELARNRFEVADVWGEGTHYLWTTALRRTEPGRKTTSAARVRTRRWDRAALESLLWRLECDARDVAPAVVDGRLSLRRLAEPFLSRHESDAPEEFVRSAYRAILGREADPDGLGFYSREIASGIPRSNTIDCLVASSELEGKLRLAEPERRG